MLGSDVNLLSWLHGRLKSGNFSLDNAHDKKAVEWLGNIVKTLEDEKTKVPGPTQPPRHPFASEWA